jgi:phosphatidate cytidylyltransferase
MLKQRVVTAVVLLCVLAVLLSLPKQWPFLVFLALACGAAAWEWWRLTLSGHSKVAMLLGLVLFLLAIITIPVLPSQPGAVGHISLGLSGLVAAVWLLGVVPTVIAGRAQAHPRSLSWCAFAPVALYTTWLCLAEIYLKRGALYMLSLLALVWIADIAAYFGGKAFGKHKLALRISPGKTLEGAAFGLTGVVAWVLLSSYWADSFAYVLRDGWGLAGALALALLLGSLSIVGDLFESLLKRRAGIKDSSNLLPGHGGVLDRIDAVIAVVPLAFLLSEGR